MGNASGQVSLPRLEDALSDPPKAPVQILPPINDIPPESQPTKPSETKQAEEKKQSPGWSESAKTSESHPRVLSSMLWIEVDFPDNKVVNLVDEYQEYLEENAMHDIRESKWQK